jgi:hypothetical protein
MERRQIQFIKRSKLRKGNQYLEARLDLGDLEGLPHLIVTLTHESSAWNVKTTTTTTIIIIIIIKPCGPRGP